MLVYTASASQWPLLQSKTEQKFKSGLFNVSAEYIRPVGNSDLPSRIDTSIGDVDVWPAPTVTVGTDGFERIHATGYGVWDHTSKEVVYSYEVASVTGGALAFEICKRPDTWQLNGGGTDYVRTNGCGKVPCGGDIAQHLAKSPERQILLETVCIKKIGDTLPSRPPLKFYDTDFTELTEITSDWLGFGEWQTWGYGGTSALNPVIPIMASLRQNKFGTITETEVVYSLRCPSVINFGLWSQSIDETQCDPGPKPPAPPPPAPA